MKQFKRVAVFVLVLFLTFAPPGTLILGAVFVLWLIGNFWLTVAVLSTLALVTALLILRKVAKTNKD